ncbi:brassinosteroid insensitive 1-associated receptor kinase 1 -like protein [Tripterygium wilfordii]|uniref:Brassinosteroid insensitive 1-associated receptor kinase 1 -like protein n=1 Tax=Tripterygium wilfordii TaxID=458696 RepID=A0A7J7DF90_TRIWF|nr:brassinosteroid insensitive 1-associated receptor kinase 1 -like protein [Tripterygium wilfordii]
MASPPPPPREREREYKRRASISPPPPVYRDIPQDGPLHTSGPQGRMAGTSPGKGALEEVLDLAIEGWSKLGIVNLYLHYDVGALQKVKNNIQGTIPAELGYLKSLVSLDLYNNIFGTIPPSLGKLKSLVFLRLNDNRLAGPISRAFVGISSLKIVTYEICLVCGANYGTPDYRYEVFVVDVGPSSGGDHGLRVLRNPLFRIPEGYATMGFFAVDSSIYFLGGFRLNEPDPSLRISNDVYVYDTSSSDSAIKNSDHTWHDFHRICDWPEKEKVECRAYPMSLGDGLVCAVVSGYDPGYDPGYDQIVPAPAPAYDDDPHLPIQGRPQYEALQEDPRSFLPLLKRPSSANLDWTSRLRWVPDGRIPNAFFQCPIFVKTCKIRAFASYVGCGNSILKSKQPEHRARNFHERIPLLLLD